VTFDLTGKTALVTGGSRGLGLTFAKALAAAGADVAITSRTVESLEGPRQEIEALGRRVVSLALDVRDQASIVAAIDRAHAALGSIDILVNNAGCNIRKPALDVTWDDWNTILDTNLRGSFFVAQAVARLLDGRLAVARVVFVVSSGGHHGARLRFSRGSRGLLAGHGIHLEWTDFHRLLQK
jgi:gluconate 5-dehydrogenase